MVYILYLWGSLTYEFSLIKNNDLFKLSIEPKQDDIQHLFPAWYDWTFEELSKINLINLFSSPSTSSATSLKINKNIGSNTFKNVLDFLEPISDKDDEIFINQVNLINNHNDIHNCNDMLLEIIAPVDDIIYALFELHGEMISLEAGGDVAPEILHEASPEVMEVTNEQPAEDIHRSRKGNRNAAAKN
ncbi:unnamed protein product [Adineta steineri]|uniref:Uncharacterized protein n=1 Tax=Adineta steineri TaxID=433720 RepID=A0A819GTY3_9BILA|nr:unnamed protein product [Adineta steineri]CAF3890396.1 unnamed protein product [Adineta steineri]